MVYYSHDQKQNNAIWLKNYLRQLHKSQARSKAKTEQEKLVETHLSLVVALTRKYMHYEGLHIADLIQDGNMGLIKAAHKYNPNLGYRFSTYANWWIKQALMQSFSEHDRLIRLPGHSITDLAKIKRAISMLELNLHPKTIDAESRQEENQIEKIAVMTKLSPRKIQQLLPYLNHMQSLDAPTTGETDSHSYIETLCSSEDSHLKTLEKQEIYHLLHKCIAETLLQKEKVIISNRYLNDINKSSASKMSLNHLGELFSTSRETIRQIEKASLQKLKLELLHHKLYH